MLKIIYTTWSIIQWSLVLYKIMRILICDFKFYYNMSDQVVFRLQAISPMSLLMWVWRLLKYMYLVVLFISVILYINFTIAIYLFDLC